MSQMPTPVLSIGASVGGTTANPTHWAKEVRTLGRLVAEARRGVDSAINVNVVYCIPGEVLEVDFSGVRTGRYDAGANHLLVQAALPQDVSDNPQLLLIDQLREAIQLAERFASEKGIATTLPELRELTERVAVIST